MNNAIALLKNTTLVMALGLFEVLNIVAAGAAIRNGLDCMRRVTSLSASSSGRCASHCRATAKVLNRDWPRVERRE